MKGVRSPSKTFTDGLRIRLNELYRIRRFHVRSFGRLDDLFRPGGYHRTGNPATLTNFSKDGNMLMLLTVLFGIFGFGLVWNFLILATMCGLEARDRRIN